MSNELRVASRRFCTTELIGELSYDQVGGRSQTIYGGHSRRPQRPKKPLFVDPVDSLTNWTSTTGTTALDIDHVVCSGLDAPASVKFTQSVGVYDSVVKRVFSPVKDLTGSFIKVRFYIHQGVEGTATDWTRIKFVKIQLRSPSAEDYQTVALYDSTAYDRPGWQEKWVDLTRSGVLAGTTAHLWSNVSEIQVRLTCENSESGLAATPSITVDEISFWPIYTNPKYAMTFDDGLGSDYAFATYLTSLGINGTFYIVTSRIGMANYLTLDQLYAMKKAGHLIANHSYDHVYYSTGLNLQQKIDQIGLATDWMCRYGFNEGARIFSIPGGTGEWESYGFEDNERIIRGMCDQVRLTSFYPCNYAVLDGTKMYTLAFDSPTDADSQLTKGIAQGQSLVTGWHSGNSPTIFTRDAWKTHVGNLVTQRDAGNIDVVVMSDLLNVLD